MNLTDGNDPEDIEEVFYELNLPVLRIVMETAPMGQVRTVFDTIYRYKISRLRFLVLIQNF